MTKEEIKRLAKALKVCGNEGGQYRTCEECPYVRECVVEKEPNLYLLAATAIEEQEELIERFSAQADKQARLIEELRAEKEKQARLIDGMNAATERFVRRLERIGKEKDHDRMPGEEDEGDHKEDLGAV